MVLLDHFHYDVTRAKVSGSCSKDRAQCRAIAGKCQKSAEAPCRPIKGKLPGVLQSYVLDCYTNSKKFSVELFIYIYFSINEELRSVVKEHFNGKLFLKFWIPSV